MFLAREFQIQQRHNRTKHRYKTAQSTDIALAMLNKDQANNDKLNDRETDHNKKCLCPRNPNRPVSFRICAR